MKIRTLLIAMLTIILIGAVLVGIGSAVDKSVVAEPKADMIRSGLANVRAFAPAIDANTATYAVDSGLLFQQNGAQWLLVDTPPEVIVNDVVISRSTPDLIYIGAANELAVYRSADAGATWMRIPLTTEYVGSVTSLALDEGQRVLYVGTDTAGIFRLRDVGSSMVFSGQQLLSEPVVDLVSDSSGSGFAFARTANALYRADNFGLEWTKVESLGSTPTALALASTTPATVFVGTFDRGVVASQDGENWTLHNAGLGFVLGSRLKIDALAIDPQQPDVLYAAASYLFGSTTVHETPIGVSMSTDGAAVWSPLAPLEGVAVAELLPVAGQPGAVYALMSNSRAPLAMGSAPEIATTELAISTVEQETVATAAAPALTGLLAWIVAGLATFALVFALAVDLRKRQPATGQSLAPSLVQK